MQLYIRNAAVLDLGTGNTTDLVTGETVDLGREKRDTAALDLEKGHTATQRTEDAGAQGIGGAAAHKVGGAAVLETWKTSYLEQVTPISDPNDVNLIIEILQLNHNKHEVAY
ncbi:uncharacterized protein V6R79_025195 [Siganus canaliculatus]